MEIVVQQIHSTTVHSQLLSFLNANEQAIIQSHEHIYNILSLLDRSEHSLGYLFLLNAKVPHIKGRESMEVFVALVRKFLLECSAVQIRMIPDKLANVCHCFADSCRELQPLLGISPLIHAVEKGQPDKEHLTSMHGDLLQLCLLSKCLKPSIAVLDQDVFKITKDLCTSKDVLLYYYYGGMVYTAVHNYPRALDFFMICFVMPCQVVSQILVEAYKKCILLSLLMTGQGPTLPKFTAVWLHRYLKNTAVAYHELANAYETRSRQELESCATKHWSGFTDDENGGLVQAVIASLAKRNVQRLTATYGTMSLAEIAENVGLPDAAAAENLILKMIELGEIDAVINQRDGMVAFTEDSHIDAANIRATLEKKMEKAIFLNEKLRAMDEAVGRDPGFLSKLSQHERQARWGDAEMHDADTAKPQADQNVLFG